MANKPQALTREQLARLLGNDQRMIIAFENLLAQAGEVLPAALEEVNIAANSALSLAAQNSGALDRIASLLEVLALAPKSVSMSEDNLQPPAREYIDEAVYGEFYDDNTNEVTAVAAVDTPYEVTGGMTGGLLRLCSFGGGHYLQVERGGIYHAVWLQSVGTTAAGDEIEGGIMINGVASSKGTAHGTVATANSYTPLGGAEFLELDALDQVSLFVSNHSAIRDITTQHASLTLNLVRRLS